MGIKMDNKGFTLVELIAVMVILVSIALVAVGGITSSLEKREIKECREQQELAISAAKIYFSLNNTATSVSIDVLNGKDGGEDYFKNDSKIDKLSNGDTITFSNGIYGYIPSDGSCVDLENNVTNGNNYVITYNYNFDISFASEKYLDTGYVVDWDKDFSIETYIKITTSGKRYLIIGNYNGTDKKAINIEINTSNKLRFYIGTGGVDKTSSDSVTIGEVIKVKFDWNALTDTYKISAKGDITDIIFSGNYSLSGKSVNTLRVGNVDCRGSSSTFVNPINVSFLEISTNEANDTSIILPTLDREDAELLGWDTSIVNVGPKYLAGDSYLVSDNKTLYAIWVKDSVKDEDSVVVNNPILDDGMIPIIIKDDGTVITVSSTSSEWFNYEQKKWANAVLVKENGSQTRSYYKSNVGVVIPESDILAYYVWIPRYKYKIWVTDAEQTTNRQTIEIDFEKASDSITKGSEIGDYMTHPAFVWDGSPVAGIWVGKFETGHITVYKNGNQMSCESINCSDADGLYIKPNMSSIHSNQIGKYFYVSSSMTRTGNPFGLSSETTDSHITKNTEWGAIAYLSDSKYGINGKIRVNNTRGFSLTTGWGALTDNADDVTPDVEKPNGIIYGKASSYPQSTTGNISGIFDMSGGRGEYVMANLNSTLKTSGLGKFPATKYYNIIPSKPVKCTLDTCGGMGIFETRGWYNATNSELMVSERYPWQYRGGKHGTADNTNTSVAIYRYGSTTGTWCNYVTYRSILIVQ